MQLSTYYKFHHRALRLFLYEAMDNVNKLDFSFRSLDI